MNESDLRSDMHYLGSSNRLIITSRVYLEPPS